MLISDSEAAARLNSSGNLINKLRAGSNGSRSKAMSLFGIGVDKPEEAKQSAADLASSLFPNLNSTSLVPTLPIKAAEIFPPEKPAAPASSAENKPPTIDDILSDADAKVKLETVHSKALSTLSDSITKLQERLPEINKAKDLADVATKMSKIVDTIRTEKARTNPNKDRPVHVHFYTPQQRKITDYEVVEVG